MHVDSVVRLVFQLDDKQVGHLAAVTDSDPKRGILCEILTTTTSRSGFALEYWLPHSERGQAWDWLRDVPVRVDYLEDEDTGEV